MLLNEKNIKLKEANTKLKEEGKTIMNKIEKENLD